ncbi:NAD(P)H-binding protein [Spirosoma montaniterrae]|uniref:NAD(P)-dependent oxidoreductase n=1 Tax=Spirosoma montaniterrae TaxID=1178516 RepID=A0A1P9X3C4_9BACT|nr:NAD(P)H-binding protein [Spirosoma montaniterrae]AQG82095.1 NAD(P)-dependent oxidoreductase [Spirosoma montaniterrae]
MLSKTVSIIGCGWLGLPIAEQLLHEGYTVRGSATSVEKIAVLRQKGIDAHLLTLSPEPVGNLSTLLQAKTLLINIPPKAGKMGSAFHPQQIQQIVTAVRHSPIQHVIYVSSTSIYPEQNRIVTESDVTAPPLSAAPALVEAEQLVQSLESTCTITILRCGGLMGYDRIPGKYVAGRTVDSGAVPVNYLHRDDAVRIVNSFVAVPKSGTYNVVAPEHPTREAVYRKSCADFGYELPTFVMPVEPVSYKIISSQKLIQAISYEFMYPNPLDFFYELPAQQRP